MVKNLVVFSHGKESGPWGSKIRAMAQIAETLDFSVVSIDYKDLPSPDDRAQRLASWNFDNYDKLVLVGSSMGAYVATVASQALTPYGLFLLAPAFYLSGYANQQPASYARHTAIIAGWNDCVIPLDNVHRFAAKHLADLHILPDEHRLMQVLPQVCSLFQSFLYKVRERQG